MEVVVPLENRSMEDAVLGMSVKAKKIDIKMQLRLAFLGP